MIVRADISMGENEWVCVTTRMDKIMVQLGPFNFELPRERAEFLKERLEILLDPAGEMA